MCSKCFIKITKGRTKLCVVCRFDVGQKTKWKPYKRSTHGHGVKFTLVHCATMNSVLSYFMQWLQ